MGMSGKVLVAACAALLAAASPAAGAVRYAEPGGTGPAGTCPQSDPCDIQTAVEHVSVMPGDVVNVLPGTYALGSDNVYIGQAITVQGAPGQPRPLLLATTASALAGYGANAVVQDLRIESTAAGGAAAAFHIQADMLVQRVEIKASGTTGWGTIVQNGVLLRDSVVWSTVAGGQAVVTGTPNGDMRNVTVIATGAGSSAIYTDSFGFGTPQDITIRNVIARAPNGVEITDGDAPGNQDVDYTISHSNLSGFSDDPPDADIATGAGMQSAAPLFVNAAAGDFRQMLGSPTINAGSADAATGPLDLDRQPRTMRGRVDIGADELPDACAGRLATVIGTSGPDVLRGTPGADVIVGLAGPDRLRGLGGNDRLCGGGGRDRLLGGAGRDRLLGQAGRDRLKGGPGRDVLRGGPGRDTQVE